MSTIRFLITGSLISTISGSRKAVKKMDIAGKLEKTFNVPRLAIAILALVFGVIVLLIPYALNIVVALFLIVWGLMEALRATGKTAK